MYFRNAWYAAGWCKDFGNELEPRMLLNERIVFYRTTTGQLVAQEDRCPHRLAPLSSGRIEGDNLRCMYHGLLFAPDGQCVKIPGQASIPAAVCVRTYPVLERHSVAWIWMGEANDADESLVPDFQGPDHPDWSMIPGRMDYRANYQLINDNLLDLSHIAWVHAASFGGGDATVNESWADMPVTITTIDRGVRVQRWAIDAPMPPYMAASAGPRGDMLNTYDFLVPGIFLLKTMIFPAGTAKQLQEGEEPDTKPIFQSFTCQAVTPLTDNTSCYFFGFGPEGDNPELAKIYYDLAIAAFTEDRLMIEAQQQVIDNDPSRRMLPLAMDGAPRRYAGVLAKMQKAEAVHA
ncbi:MAG: Rieske (2Fe-2S) protein [Novosphingobium lindaniclasticum]|uniref:aromatic ring-hydroxylating dioxygenase subunit alpha n=1 Tax=Novosphingobium lindaniclasticum TaxID=1329895 RepID=UPI00240A0249|nr:aromatic ring-hydroxylating dioxygenase subunit alpha [Novosphingobium lindaniclasticum]MDF2638475.1 Rieske (2Fe-2S) protein [Novosphingobium lindaniclasticum]